MAKPIQGFIVQSHPAPNTRIRPAHQSLHARPGGSKMNASRKSESPSSAPASSTSAHKPTTVSVFDALPNSAYLRESQLVQSAKRPGSPALLPFSAPTLWRKVRAGTFPKPVRLSERVTAWSVGAVRDWIDAQSSACKPEGEVR
jgi:predicted DNA-binding transcriptional regulator AlpA